MTYSKWVALACTLAVPVFIVLFIIYPFANLIVEFGAFHPFSILTGSSAGDDIARRALINSLTQGAVSAFFSFLAGFPLGLYFGRYEFRFRRLMSSYALLPFFLPSIVVVFAFLDAFGPGSILQSKLPFLQLASSGFTGIIAVNTFFNTPLVMLTTMVAVASADPQLEEASYSLGAGAIRTFRRTWGRDAVVYGLGGALLAFIYSFSGFTAPLIIGGQGFFTLEAWIYFMARILDQIGNAASMSVIEVLLLLPPSALYVVFSRSRFRSIGSGQLGRRKGHGKWYLIGGVYTAFWFAAETYLFAGTIIYSLHDLKGNFLIGFEELFSPLAAEATGITAAGAAMNSIFYALVASLIVTSLGLAWKYAGRRMRRGFASLDVIQLMPLMISAVVLALSLNAIFSPLVPASMVWLLIVLAQSVVAVPVVFRIIASGFENIPISLSEASLSLGGNPFFEVEMPIASTAISTAMIMGAATSLGEFAATNFLATSRFISLTVEIYTLQNARLFAAAGACVTLLLVISILLFTAIQWTGEGIVGLR